MENIHGHKTHYLTNHEEQIQEHNKIGENLFTDIGTDYNSVVAQFQIKLEDPGGVRKTLKISRCQLFDGSYYVDELWIIRKKGLE